MLLSVSGIPCGGDRRECIGVHEREIHLLHRDPHGGDQLFRVIVLIVLRNLCSVFYYDLCKLQEECGGVDAAKIQSMRPAHLCLMLR